MNIEHIIPLSLGGANNFSIYVNADINAKLGTKVDGRLTQDYLISSIRRKKQLLGHSKKEPITILKKVTIKDSNKPIQLKFDAKNNYVFDPIKKRYLKPEECVGMEFSIQLDYDKFIRTLFVAKTALATGYLIYKEKFLNFADHHSLRNYMKFAFHRDKTKIMNLDIRFMDPFNKMDDETSIWTRNYFEAICSLLNCSLVMFVIGSQHILASVAIGGKYIGTINFKADVNNFQDEGKLKGGFIVGVQNGKAILSSFDYIEELIRAKYNRTT
jgi:hypothetical protein